MASFDENGKYIKTNWKAGDKITATKLNKIEESIEAVNDNDISRHVEADARLDALEAKDVAHDKEFTNVKNTIADNKAAAELGDYEINSRMQFLEDELEEAVAEVNNVASTVDGKIAQAEVNMTAQVNQGKADMEAMVAEVEADLEGLHAKDEELSEQLVHIENNHLSISVKDFGAVGNGVTDDTEAIQNAIDSINGGTVFFPSGVYKISSTIVITSRDICLQGEGFSSSEIKLDGSIIGIECNRTTCLKNLHINGVDKTGTGIITRNKICKVVITNCQISYCNIAIVSTDSWTIWLKECELFYNNIGYSIYYSKGETTTINITSNTMWENGKNIVVGDTSMDGYSSDGTQCTTLLIKDNVLDNSPCEINGVIVNVIYEANHAELPHDSEYILKLERPYSAKIRDNYLKGAKKCVYISNSATRNVDISNNSFYNTVTAIDIKNIYHSNCSINDNYYSGCTTSIIYPYYDTDKSYGAKVMMRNDAFSKLVNGCYVGFSDNANSSGRFKIGSIIFNTSGSEGSVTGWKFMKNSSKKNWGVCSVTQTVSNCNTDGATNTATLENIESFRVGDLVKIDSESSESVIIFVDYENKIIKTDPKITSTSTTSISTHIGKWVAF